MDRIQVNLRGLPSHVLEAVCRPDTALNTRSTESMISPLTFPKSKIHLWDPTPNGDLVNLHLSWYRKPRLLLMEKALRLAHRHARQSKKPQFSCFLLGTLAVESDEEGVAITLDRFDPGRDQPNGLAKSPTALLPGDVLVPCLFDIQHVSNATVYSARDLDITFKLLEQSCTNREAMEIWKVMSLRVRLSCVENMDRLSFTLHWAGVTLANSLEAVPVRVLPIIPTALARNLSSSASMAQPVHSHTNVKKRGFLTMDQTRKLLLILESDPKAYTLPLVGVWLSGVTHIHSPVVWAWCLRYLYSSSLCDKVMSEDDAFLVVLYSLTHRDPEFYQCKRHGSKDMSFQLISSTESLTLYKNVEPAEGRLLPFELGTEIQNQEAELFQEALSSSALSRAGATSSVAVQNKLSISDHDSGVEDEDLSPRPSPNPHPINHQIKQVQPSVPELSMVLDSSFLDGMVGKSHQHTPMHSVQSSPHLWNSSSSTPLTRTAPQPPAQSVMTGPPPIRRPLTPVLSQSKSNRTQSTIGNQPSICRKSIPSMERRSSNGFSVSQSSSSSSSPKTGLSPSDSIHEHAHKSHHPKPPPPNQKSKKLSINRDQTLPPPPSQQVVFHSTPVFSPTCSCCPSHYSHIPVYHGNNTWQGTSSPAVQNHVACPPEGSPHQDCCLSPTRPTLSLGSNTAQSPMCHAVVPLHCSLSQGSHFPNPCGGALDQTTPVHLAQCCQLQPDPAAITSPDSGMRLLQADAYRMLMEQDRQLKQLQAQIQKLLDAQNKVSEPPQASPEKQQEQAIQTSPFPELLKKTGVSIAVGTGASLFWSSPSQSSVHERQSVECHSDANSAGSSRLDSKKVYQSREEPSPEASQHSTSPQHNTLDVGVSFQSPVFEQSASIYSVSQTHDTEESSQNGEIPDERFYQELLGQVQNRLQDKIIEEQMEQDVQSPGPRHSMTPRTTPPNKPVLRQHNAKGTEEDRVFSATLKQLQSLGVNMELSTGQSTRSTVESASTLACINPDAVIPRLTLSEPVGTSIWGLSGGVDLSLEANAIALKYLSDSQLSRLSMGSQSTGARSNPSALLLGKAALENNSTGLSILSSSNMSLATCKYMKKYGLMESGGSEEEEDDTGETIQRTQADSALGCSMQLNVSENVEREKQTGLILKNVSNKQPDRLLSTGESQSQLIRDLRPKMQLLVKSKNGSEKENTPEHVVPQPRPQRRSSLSDNQRCASVPETQGSVGNFLDLSRLRQLPKLF